MDAKHAPSGEMHLPPPRGGREYLELWISLSRREWGSLVFIPADRDGSTAEIASALADVGQRLSYEPVTAITVSSLEYGSALALADLQQHLDRERRSRAHTVVTRITRNPQDQRPGAPQPGDASGTAAGTAAASEASSPAPGEAQEPATPGPAPSNGTSQSEALAVMPTARLIISVPPVLTEPLGLAAVQQADAVVLAVRMNRSRMVDVRRTLDLVGRDRVIGCFIVR